MHKIDKFQFEISEDPDVMHLNIRITFKVDWFLMAAQRIQSVTCKVISGNTDNKVIEHQD